MASKKKRKKREREAWNRFGDNGRAALIAAATSLPHRAGDERLSPATCLIAVRAITKALKLAFPERRPRGQGRHSFPSEHAALSVAAAIIIEREYPGRVGAAAYALAAAVALSRIEGRKHYPRDIVAGALIGFGAVLATFELNKLIHRLDVQPDYGATGSRSRSARAHFARSAAAS